jgi:hypothetical protein
VIISDATSGCNAIISNAATLTINPDPSITTQPVGNTICAGGSQSMSVVAANGVDLNYQWQYDNGGVWEDVTTDSPLGASYTGATMPTLTTNGITAVGNHDYRVIISDATSDCNTIISDVATIVINADVLVNITGGGGSYCSGAPVKLTANVTNGTGTITYQWQSSPDGLASWINIVSANAVTYLTPSLTTTSHYRVIVNAAGAGCDEAVSVPTTITIFPDPTVSISTDQTICTGATATLTATINGGLGTCTLQWQESVNGANFSDIPGENGSTYTPSALTKTTCFRAKYICTGAQCGKAISGPTWIYVTPTPLIKTGVSGFTTD